MEENSVAGVSPYRGSVGKLGEGFRLPGTLKISWRMALNMEHLTLWELC